MSGGEGQGRAVGVLEDHTVLADISHTAMVSHALSSHHNISIIMLRHHHCQLLMLLFIYPSVYY